MIDRSSFEPTLNAPQTRQAAEHWKSLEELAGRADFDTFLRQEWMRPPETAGEMDRRTLIKLLMANMAVLGVAACDESPSEEIVGYVDRPESVTPGVPSYYATALTLSGYASGVLGETHSGRPTRVQGNPDDAVSGGATSAIQQAAVYDLYDPDRLQAVDHRNQTSSWDRFLGQLAELRLEWANDRGARLRLLTGRITSPSLAAGIDDLRRQFPEMRWHVWEPVERSAVRDGAVLAFGEAVDTLYHLRRAQRLLSLDADFLGPEEPAHLTYARDFAASRAPKPDGDPPARLYAVESTPTVTGAKADHRLPVRFSLVEPAARAIAVRLGIDVDAPPLPEGIDGDWLDSLVADLKDHRGACAVIPGFQQPAAVHALAHAINHALGAVDATVTYHAPVAVEPDGPLQSLMSEIDEGAVGTLVVLGGNPVHDAPADFAFGARMEKVETTVYWGLHANETAAFASWVLPATHEFEAWGDARAFDGTTYLQQPLVRPLHGGRSSLELLDSLAGDFESGGRDLLRRRWEKRAPVLADDIAWRAALQRGTVAYETAAPRKPTVRRDFRAALPAPSPQPDGLELQFRPHPAIWDGRFAGNGWLQELPDPLTKLVWGNAALVPPGFARDHELESGDIVRLKVGGRTLEAPVWPMPGQPKDAVTLHLGYGRRRAGQLGSGVGVDAYPLRTSTAMWSAPGLTVTPTGSRETLVTTQRHHDIEGRDLLRKADWRRYREDPNFARHRHEEELPSLYPEPKPASETPDTDAPRYAWGMVIDFDACIGCNACVAACQSENNIPIVGKDEVRRGREMHWLRIDRYYAGPPENPETALQPIPCMHCENAPCEYVCPVEATQHSVEGLNEMVYNRCIGTRYCSQNCPYKVRRFNWFDYTGPDAELPFHPALQNPDVTVRSRGVMEKCTYCVQRINRARITAEREGRRIQDGEVVTACQEACPSRAIVFGDLSDPDSEVSRRRRDPRNYGLLAELNTRPRTTYLAQVRHPNPALVHERGSGGDDS